MKGVLKRGKEDMRQMVEYEVLHPYLFSIIYL
jgi:hypothetical protein